MSIEGVPTSDQTELEQLRSAVAAAHLKIENLEIALRSSRRIGAAIGVLMVQRNVTIEHAFDLLREASQHTHRKLHDIAEEVLYTGTLDADALLREVGASGA